jgi:hypothetical protein
MLSGELVERQRAQGNCGRLWAGFECARCGFVGIAGKWSAGIRCKCGYLWTVKREEGGAVRWQITPSQRQERPAATGGQTDGAA